MKITPSKQVTALAIATQRYAVAVSRLETCDEIANLPQIQHDIAITERELLKAMRDSENDMKLKMIASGISEFTLSDDTRNEVFEVCKAIADLSDTPLRDCVEMSDQIMQLYSLLHFTRNKQTS